jgi:thioredoxin 2
MSDSRHIVCQHCHTTNRVQIADLGHEPDCGKCHQPLTTTIILSLVASLVSKLI